MKKRVNKAVVAFATTALLTTALTAGTLGGGIAVTGDTTTLRGDVVIQNGIRLEPYFGFDYTESRVNDTNFNLGVAGHLLKELTPVLTMYYGGYVGYTSDDAQTGATFNLGPVAGVEYALDPQFTLGAEVRFDMGFGDTTVMKTASAVTLRYYYY